VNYSRQRNDSSSEHYASDLSLLKADAPYDVKISGARNRTLRPMDPKASVLTAKPQRPTTSTTTQYCYQYAYIGYIIIIIIIIIIIYIRRMCHVTGCRYIRMRSTISNTVNQANSFTRSFYVSTCTAVTLTCTIH